MTETLTPAARVELRTAARVAELQRLYRANVSEGVAALAKLRRGVGQPPSSDIELFGIALGESGPSLHDDTRPLPDSPTAEERAFFAALTLYALHQQSRRDASMHQAGYSFGRSARLLGRRAGARDAVRTRFAALGTAVGWDETLHHARGLVQQFRQHRIPLDYAQFARDLYELRFPARAERVRTVWGRDFYRTSHPDDDLADAEPTEDGSATGPSSDD